MDELRRPRRKPNCGDYLVYAAVAIFAACGLFAYVATDAPQPRRGVRDHRAAPPGAIYSSVECRGKTIFLRTCTYRDVCIEPRQRPCRRSGPCLPRATFYMRPGASRRAANVDSASMRTRRVAAPPRLRRGYSVEMDRGGCDVVVVDGRQRTLRDRANVAAPVGAPASRLRRASFGVHLRNVNAQYLGRRPPGAAASEVRAAWVPTVAAGPRPGNVAEVDTGVFYDYAFPAIWGHVLIDDFLAAYAAVAEEDGAAPASAASAEPDATPPRRRTRRDSSAAANPTRRLRGSEPDATPPQVVSPTTSRCSSRAAVDACRS